MKKILFICRGNVARSQIAKEIFNKQAGENFKALSAGTKLSRGEQTIGEFGSIVDNLITVTKEEGIDISQNKSKEINREIVSNVDKVILIMDDEDPVPDYLVDNPKVTRWTIKDPKGKSLEFTRKVRDEIKRRVKELITEL
ncbi:MAG: arsenate reductase ArsC [Candidatus Paceibacterota bacterium]